MAKRGILVLFYIFVLIFGLSFSKYTTKPDIIDAIEEDPDVMGNISPSNFDKLDDLKDQNLSDDEKLQKAKQILKSDSDLKSMADNIIRRVSSGSIDTSGSSINSKFGSIDSSIGSIGSDLSSGKILSNIKSEFETNSNNIYSTLSSKAKEVVDEITAEIEDTDLSLPELATNVKSILSGASTSVKDEIKNLIPEELNIDSGATNVKSSLSDKFGSIKNGIKSIFSKHSTTESYIF